MNELTEQEKEKFLSILLHWFPWVDSDDSISGADVVEHVEQLIETLRG